MKKSAKEIGDQAIYLLRHSDQLSAEQIAKEIDEGSARVNRVLLQNPEIHFNGFMFEYLEPDDPRRSGFSIHTALDSSKWKPTLFGQRIMHSWAEIAFLEQLLGHYVFDNFVELGTASGGLTTLFMLHSLINGSHVLSVDIGREPDTDPYRTLATISTYKFISGDAIHPNPKNERIIQSTIQRDGRTLLYCDANGYREARIDQMNHWVPYMKRGDVVVSHDYPAQITEVEVTPLIDKYNLKPFHQEEAWKLGCRMLIYERS